MYRAAGLLFACMMALTTFFGACSSPTLSEKDKVPVKASSMFIERNYKFCSELIPDRFLVGYFGDSLLGNDVHFFIVCYRGDTVYRDHWPAYHMLPAGADSSMDAEAQTQAIRTAMEHVVTGEVAAPLDSAKAANYGQYPFFSYQLSAEHIRQLVYVPEKKKVLEL
ncbi:MAG: hypothetical protein AAF570_14630 [Bacteroidota bacterium]